MEPIYNVFLSFFSLSLGWKLLWIIKNWLYLISKPFQKILHKYFCISPLVVCSIYYCLWVLRCLSSDINLFHLSFFDKNIINKKMEEFNRCFYIIWNIHRFSSSFTSIFLVSYRWKNYIDNVSQYAAPNFNHLQRIFLPSPYWR